MAESSPSRSRKRLSVDKRREQLIALGRRMFEDTAYEEVSIDDVAREGDISKGLLYHYFPGKRGFYLAIIRSTAEDLRRVTEPDPSLPPLQRFQSSLDAWMSFVWKNTRSFSAMLRAGLGEDKETARVVEKNRSVMVKRLTRGMGLDKPSPLLRAALRGWIAFADEMALQWTRRRGLKREEMRHLLLVTLASVVKSCIDLKALADQPDLREAAVAGIKDSEESLRGKGR